MKKRVTNDDVAKFIGETATKIRDELDYDYRVAKSQMWIAEKDFLETLDQKQRDLYYDLCKKKDLVLKLEKDFCSIIESLK